MSVGLFIIYCLFMPDHVVAYPEKLLKTIVTRCAIFSLKFIKNRLAAGLGPAGELKRSASKPLAAIWGLLLREGEGKEGKGGKEVERGGGNGREGEGKGGKG